MALVIRKEKYECKLFEWFRWKEGLDNLFWWEAEEWLLEESK